MTASKFVLMVVLAVLLFASFAFALSWWDPANVAARGADVQRGLRERDELAPLMLTVKRMIITSAGAGISIASFLIPVALALWLMRELLLLRHSHGVFPAFFQIFGLRASEPVGNSQAHVEYARVSGRQRPLGAPKLSKPDEQLYLPEPAQEPEAEAELLAEDVLMPDMKLYNNKMVIAQSRFGKTATGWAFIRRARAALPDCEFLVLSVVEYKWPGMCAASTPDQMLDAMLAVEKEIDRRDKLLKQLGITDVHEHEGVLPALIIVFDEVEASIETFPLAKRKEFERLVNLLVKTGGNIKMGLFALSQTGDRSIMPKSMLNNTDLLMGRVGPYVPATFNITDRDLVRKLTTCENGHYYSYRHQAWVTMPVVKPPMNVRLSGVYAPPLQLTADGDGDNVNDIDTPSTPTEQEIAEANVTVRDALLSLGYGKTEVQEAIRDIPDNIPDTEERLRHALASFANTVYAEQPPTVVESTTAHNRPKGGEYQVVVPVVQPPRGPYGIRRIETRRPPTPDEARDMRAARRAGASMTRICMAAWGFKDGSENEPVWSWMKDALEGRI